MRVRQMNEMIKGWFIGAFEPTVLNTAACEVAVKEYSVGQVESRHVHRVATEITVVVRGSVRMENVIYAAGTIIVLEPGDATDFEALEDALTVVVKLPSVMGDKYSA